MMKRTGLIILMLAALLAVACRERNTGMMRPIQLVETIVADTSSYHYRQISALKGIGSHGSIALVGDPEDVMRLTEYLLTYDGHDNISGAHLSDGLPDFSGETIAQILDVAGSPYSAVLQDAGAVTLREKNLKNFLLATDTAYVAGPYDGVMQHRQSAKMVVFASSYSSAYGRYDADTLCRSIGLEYPVIAPVQAMEAYADMKTEGTMNLAVWTDMDKISGGLYDGLQAFAPQTDTTADDQARLCRFLDMYVDAGNSARLSAVLLDDPDVDAEAMESAARMVIASTEDNLLNYRNLLDNGFEFITPGEAIAEQCYAYLRRANAFTHRIAYPELRSYITMVQDEPEGETVLVGLQDRYFPTPLMEFMVEYAPKSFSLYVR